jgi:hypothetical protein
MQAVRKRERGRRVMHVCREISGTGCLVRRRRLARIRRMLVWDGFILGRKLVVTEGAQRVAIAFPNFIRAKRATLESSRRAVALTISTFDLLEKLLKG